MSRFDSNTQLVYFVFNENYQDYREHEEDLIQEGFMGLWKACQTFDASRGTKFSTYAVKVIKNEMGMYLRRMARHSSNLSLDNFIGMPEDGTTFLNMLEDTPENKLTVKEEYILMSLKKAAERMNCTDILEMRLKGMKQVDIAKELGIHQATVSERMRTLYNMVRKELGIEES